MVDLIFWDLCVKGDFSIFGGSICVFFWKSPFQPACFLFPINLSSKSESFQLANLRIDVKGALKNHTSWGEGLKVKTRTHMAPKPEVCLKDGFENQRYRVIYKLYKPGTWWPSIYQWFFQVDDEPNLYIGNGWKNVTNNMFFFWELFGQDNSPSKLTFSPPKNGVKSNFESPNFQGSRPFRGLLGGGFKHFLFSPRTLGKNFTHFDLRIFFRWGWWKTTN